MYLAAVYSSAVLDGLLHCLIAFHLNTSTPPLSALVGFLFTKDWQKC